MAINEYDNLLEKSVAQKTSGNEYDGLLESEQEMRKTSVQNSMFVATKKDPETRIKAMQLADQVKMPVDLVERNYDKISKQAATANTDYDKIINDTPGLAKWLEDPENAVIGQRDLEKLGQIDKGMSRFKKQSSLSSIPAEFAQAARTGYNDLESSALHLAAVYGLADPEMIAGYAADANKKSNELRSKAPDYVQEFQKVASKESADVTENAQKFFKSYVDYKTGATLQTLKDLATSGTMTIGESIDLIYSTIIQRPRATAYTAVESLAMSVPSLVTGLVGAKTGAAAGLATGPLAPVAAPVLGTAGFIAGSFAGSAPTEIGAYFNQALSEKGYDITNPEDILRAYRDPKLMDEVRGEAERKGITTAAVDSVFNLVAGKYLKGATGQGILRRAGAAAQDVVVQTAGEIGSEVAGLAAVERGDLTKVDFGGALLEGITSMGQSIGETVIGAGVRAAYSKDTAVAAEEVAVQTKDAVDTMQDLQTMQQVANTIKETTDVKNVPQKLKALIESSTEGGEPASVFFQSDDFDNFWSNKGKPPGDVARDLLGENAQKYFEAKESGGTIEVPMSDFISKMATDDSFDELLGIVRTKSDGMTLTEAQEHLRNLPGLMKSLADEAQAGPLDADARFEADVKLVKENVKQQLKVAGFSDKDADAQASLYESTFRSLAQRSGMSPRELFESYNLRVNRGGQAAQVDEFGRILSQEYRGQHTAPSPDPDIKNRLDDISETLPDITTVSEEQALRYYGYHDRDADLEVIRIVRDAAANPEKEVTIYRAVPKGVKDINSGDWVALTKYYADLHGQNRFDGEYDVVEMKVKANELFNSGDLQEWGYWKDGKADTALFQSELEEEFSLSAYAIQEELKESLAEGEELSLDIYDNQSGRYVREVESGFSDIAPLTDEQRERAEAGGFDTGNVWYHGTKGDIIEFSNDALGESTGAGSAKMAHFFASSPNTASDYAVASSDPLSLRSARLSKEAEREKKLFNTRMKEKYGSKWTSQLNAEEKAERQAIKSKEIEASNAFATSLESTESKIDMLKYRIDESEKSIQYMEQRLKDKSYLEDNESSQAFVDRNEELLSDKYRWEVQEGRFYNIVNNETGERIKNPYLRETSTSGPESVYRFFQSPESLRAQIEKVKIKISNNSEKNLKDTIKKEKASLKEMKEDLSNRLQGIDGEKVYRTVLKMENPLIVDFKGAEYREVTYREILEKAQDYGYDSVIFKNTYDPAFVGSMAGEPELIDVAAVFNPASIRSTSARFEDLQSANILYQSRYFEVQRSVPMPESVDVISTEPVSTSIGEVKAKAREKLKGKSFVNKHTGWDIQINSDGFSKGASVIASEENRAAFLNTDKLLENAVLIRSEDDLMARDENIRKIHHLYSPIEIGTTTYISKITVRETKDGVKYYGGFTVESPIGLRDTSTELGTQGPVGSLNIQQFLDSVNEARRLDPLFQDQFDPRGQIRFGSGGINIDLLKNADPSTFLHETGHFYLKILKDLTSGEDAPQQLKDDAKIIAEWLGAEDISNITVEQEEKWARGFEAYLMEGKAPSEGLRKAFAKFKVWLTTVYRSLTNLNVQLTDEVRGVMDRLVATEDEINRAEQALSAEPLLGDVGAYKMTGKMAQDYFELISAAREEAESLLAQRMLEDYRKEQTKEYNNKRKEIKAQVVNELNEQPIYRALSILQTGKMPDGSDLPQGVDPIKLNRDALIERYGKDFLKQLPKPYIYSREGGVHPDVAASMMGFESGSALIDQITKTVPKDRMAETITDQRMLEIYPDIRFDDGLSQEAINASLNEKRTQITRMEMQWLLDNAPATAREAIRRIARRVPTDAAVREQAANIINAKNVGDIKPYVYQRAVVKYAKEAASHLANGDFDRAFDAKQKELLNQELHRAAMAANEKVKKSLDKVKKIAKKDEDVSKTRDVDLVNAARAILSSYGIGRFDEDPMTYLKPIAQYDPDTYATISALVESVVETAGNYKSIRFDDYMSMIEAVDAVWSLSKTSKEIEIAGKRMSRDQAITELGDQIFYLTDGGDGAGDGYQRAATTWEKAKMNILGVRSALRRVESWVEAIDVGDANGVFRRYIWNPVSDGVNKYRVAKQDVLKTYLDNILKPYVSSLTNDPIRSDELRYEFKNKAELMGALLHTGNESNMSKLLRGRGWGSMREDGTLDMNAWNTFINRLQSEGVLTKADYDFVQNVWDLMESLKPQAQKAHKDMYGYYFNEITAKEIVTPFGIYRGGYMPAVVDQFLSEDAAIRSEKESIEKNNNSFMFPTTGRGFTKSRVEAYAAPLDLDLGRVTGHIDKVLRFIHIEPRVKDVSRIVMDKGFRSMLSNLDKTVGSEMLVPWLQRAAQQQVQTPSKGWAGKAADKFFGEMRKRSGLGTMALNVVNTLQQITGLSMAAVKVSPKYLRNGLWNYIKSPKDVSASVVEKSDFMKTRVASQVFDIQKNIDEILLNPTKYERALDFATKHGYVLQAGFQNVIDTTIWAGAYEQAVAEGLSEVDAVRAADSAVRLTQGSFNAEDVSRFESGTAFARAFTMFYSYFNMQANLLTTEFSNIIRDTGLRKGAGRGLYIYALGFMVPAVMAELIVKAMSGDLDEDDDEQYIDDLMSTFFNGQFRTATAFFPVIGPSVQAGINAFNDKWYDDRISTSPAVNMLESAVSAPFSVYSAIAEDGNKKKAARDFLSALTLLTGLPGATLARPLGYSIDVAEGNAEPSGPVDFVRGLVTGRPGDN